MNTLPRYSNFLNPPIVLTVVASFSLVLVFLLLQRHPVHVAGYYNCSPLQRDTAMVIIVLAGKYAAHTIIANRHNNLPSWRGRVVEYYVGLAEIKWFEVALLRLADSLFCLILPWTTTQRIVHLLSRTVQMILTTSNSSESASELDL